MRARDQQREVGVLVLGSKHAFEEGLSTLTGTIHASADTMEYVLLEGGDLLRDYSPKERRRMAMEGRARPNGSFPIGTCADAEVAMNAQGRAAPSEREAVQAFIRRRVLALRCDEG